MIKLTDLVPKVAVLAGMTTVTGIKGEVLYNRAGVLVSVPLVRDVTDIPDMITKDRGLYYTTPDSRLYYLDENGKAVRCLTRPPPVILKQPVSVTATTADYVTLTVEVDGKGLPVSYAWTRDGLPSGGPTFDIGVHGSNGVGTWTFVCTVTTAKGSVVSDGAVVTIV